MLPPSAQAAVRDVDAAYRTIPLHPSQWPGTVLHDEQSNFYIDYCLGFGLSPAAGAWGLVADASADIMRRNGVAVVLKWVDDFIFITVPLGDLHLANQSLRQRRFNTLPQAHHRGGAAYFLTQEGEEQADDGFGSFRNLTGATLPHQLVTSFNAIDNITKPLGLPWKASKDRDFATTQQYTGFVFDIPARTVHLPDTKRQRYLENVCAWMRRPRSTLAQADTLLGQLQHAAFVHSAGRKRLAYLRQFQAVNSHHHREASLHPPRQLHSDLLWHTALSGPDRRRCFAADTTTRDLQLYTDASEWGVGVFIGNDIYSLPFSHNIPTPFSILWAEALAFEIGLRIAIDRGAADCALPVHCNNAAVVASSQSDYMRHQSVMLILQRIRILEAQANIDVCPTYVRSEHNLPTLHHVGNRGTNHLPHLYTSHPPLPTTSHTMSSLIDDHIRAALDILQSRTRPARPQPRLHPPQSPRLRWLPFQRELTTLPLLAPLDRTLPHVRYLLQSVVPTFLPPSAYWHGSRQTAPSCHPSTTPSEYRAPWWPPGPSPRSTPTPPPSFSGTRGQLLSICPSS
ncbi:hypothetical protein A4X03_0g8944 [Tilletia caries]|uniref:Reverse transcriptase domain-containing protein n=1 Tax=Tilletia caries TaxID=13290 RepID=A0A8T8SEA2_9BASI|nr:hypothetical protein A4X03_0g8944 [Tilletia caries]